MSDDDRIRVEFNYQIKGWMVVAVVYALGVLSGMGLAALIR